MKSRGFDIVVPMDLCVDFLLDCADVTPEYGQREKLVSDYTVEMGGSASIFACQAAKLGLKVAGIGVVGHDPFGELIVETLLQAGVSTEWVRIEPGAKTGVGVALCRRDDRAILTYPGTIDGVRPEDISLDVLRSARHLHVGSFYLMRRLQPAYPEILREAKRLGLTVSLDTNWDPDETWDGGIMDCLSSVDVFFPNLNELLAITRSDTPGEAVQLLAPTVATVVVKNGAGGATAYRNEDVVSAPAFRADVADTVGAGDSFDAGFLFGFLGGFSLEQSLQLGCFCGSSSTARPGGTVAQPILAELRRFFGWLGELETDHP